MSATQALNRNPYNGYINPYYWVDDHPLLYGTIGSLDPSTYPGHLTQFPSSPAVAEGLGGPASMAFKNPRRYIFSPAIWVISKIGVSQNGWFIMENPIKPIKMDDFGGTIVCQVGVEPKIMGVFRPQLIHVFIGFSIIILHQFIGWWFITHYF